MMKVVKETMPSNTPADFFTVTTLNILHLPFFWEERMNRIAVTTGEIAPEIFCVQEVIFDDDLGTSATLQKFADASGLSIASVDPHHREGDGAISSGVAILSSWPTLEAGAGQTPDDEEAGYNSCYAVLQSPTGRVVIVFTVHGAWGGHREITREKQFMALNKHANELEAKYAGQEPIVILTGDFNTTPESATMRFLTGKASLHGESTYWVDSWDVCGQGSGVTSDPKTKLAVMTAQKNHIHFPEFLPKRRIDYVLIKGWVYGKIGTPVRSEICYAEADEDGYTVSDHYGISTEIWNPFS